MLTHQVIWQLSLSNGETHQEGKGLFEEVEGELSPWNKLLAYLNTQQLTITSLSLVHFSSRSSFNLPSMGKNPNFKPFREATKPIFYGFMRCIAKEKNWGMENDPEESETKEWYSVIKAQYPEHSLQIWVSEIDPKQSWVLIEKN